MHEVGRWGVIRESLLKQLKRVVDKGRNYLYGGGDLEGVTTPASPHKNFNCTLSGQFSDGIPVKDTLRYQRLTKEHPGC